MPTPMAIIMTAWLEKLGMLMKLTDRPTRAMPDVMPKRAVMRGRPMASTEPKAMSRMTMAAMKPRPSLPNSTCSRKMSPPSSTERPGSSTSEARRRAVSPASLYSIEFRSARFTSA